MRHTKGQWGPVSQAKLARSFARRAVVSWREHPTQSDIEALRANIERVGLVIRVRWVIVAALALFSVIAGLVYSVSMPLAELAANMTVPALALVFVLAYNAFYQRTYRKFGNIAYLNQAQLLFDIFVVTVLVYYSGGVASWFSSMCIIFILEGAFILPERGHVWVLVGAASIFVGAVFFGWFAGWLPPVDVPFVDTALHENLTYVVVRYLWEVAMYMGAALVGTVMMQTVRRREAELSESTVTDELTGLFNSQYFQWALSIECARARSAGSCLALLLVDIDRLSDVNRMFGMGIGDSLLEGVAGLVRAAAEGDSGGDPGSAAAVDGVGAPGIACRVGGEEFAIILPGASLSSGERVPIEVRAALVAERLRLAVGSLRVEDVGVTVSIGISVWPRDGATAPELLDAADAALAIAAASGGNTVRRARSDEVASDGDV